MTNNGRIDCLNCSFDELVNHIEETLRKGDNKEANMAIAYCRGRISVVKDQHERQLWEQRLQNLLSKVTMTKTGGAKQKIDFSKSKSKRA